MLAESEKFDHHGAVPLRLQGKPTTLITDAGLREESRRSVEALSITVLVA